MNTPFELAQVLAQIDDPALMDRFLEEILTPSEKKDISLRWQLLKDLHAGKTQRDIAAEYRISLCKITRGSRILKDDKSVTRKLLQGHEKKGEQKNEKE